MVVADESLSVGGEREEEPLKEKKKGGNLDKFWHLSNVKSINSRIVASSKLLKQCATNPSEAAYTLKRLLSGLASPAESSRQTFFVCLVEFFRQQNFLYSDVRREMNDSLQVTGSTKGEESSFLLAQILADIAMLRSEKFKSKDEHMDILKDLIDQGSKRSYLHLIALKTIVEYYLVGESDVSFDELLEQVKQSFKLNLPEATLDSLYFILAFLNHEGVNVSPDQIANVFEVKDISKKSSLELIHKVVMGSMLPLSVFLNHPVMEQLARLVTGRKVARKLFGYFVLDMATTAYKGQIVTVLLREILKRDSTCMEELLSAEVLESLRQLSMKGGGNLVLEIVDLLQAEVKSGDLNGWTILQRLLDSCMTWDKHVPGNLISFLIAEGDESTIMQTGDHLLQMLNSDTKISERVQAASLLAKVIGHPKLSTNIDWRVEKLSALFELTMVSTPNSTAHPLTMEAKTQLKDVFYRGLDSNCKTLIDNVDMVHRLMNHAIHLIDKKSSTPIKAFKGTTQEAWDNVVGLVKKLGKSWKESHGKETGVFLLLFCQVGLQLFCQPEMAVDVLTELKPVYANWNKAKRSEGAPAGIEVAVEIMLSLLAQNKHLLRKVVNCIFKVVSDQMTAPALQSLLDVISAGVQDDDSNEGEESEEEEDDEDDVDDDGEVDEDDEPEEVNGEEIDDGEDESEDESQNVEMESATVDKIKTALGEHADASGAEDSDIDMDDIPDEDMQKLDEKLVEAFKALGGRKSSVEKKKEKLDQLANQHFKLRVLDLLDIYVTHKPTAEHVFLIISSLLDSFRILFANPKEAVLCTRMQGILKKCSVCKLEPSQDLDPTMMLESLLQYGATPSSAIINLGNVHARLCLTALRVNLTEYSEKAEELYMKALNEFYNNHKCILSQEVFQLAVGISWKGAISIAKEVAKRSFDAEVRHYRRTQGLAILASFMKNQQLGNTFCKEKKKILKVIVTNTTASLSTDLGKAKPKQLGELFSILKIMKQQDIMSEEQTTAIKSSLQDFAESAAPALQGTAVKKALKKLLSFYAVKANFRKGGKSKPEQSVVAEPTEHKKKKKKKKNKKGKSKVEGEGPEEATPSFSEFVMDTTKVFAEKPNKKRKHADGSDKTQKKKKKTKS